MKIDLSNTGKDLKVIVNKTGYKRVYRQLLSLLIEHYTVDMKTSSRLRPDTTTLYRTVSRITSYILRSCMYKPIIFCPTKICLQGASYTCGNCCFHKQLSQQMVKGISSEISRQKQFASVYKA